MIFGQICGIDQSWLDLENRSITEVQGVPVQIECVALKKWDFLTVKFMILNLFIVPSF